ncbi:MULTISPECIES: M13-type metalloendopeptidase [unclassified Undibacterium]|uniref:M13-type metalloendopeptidase n=2 Tax=Pseudomonadota TaxID=1224 RepID=UPI002AC978E5|nr:MULTISPECIES: M13-type metalloendopeptidase [unclassified Undibacterium]MEB0138528.1 M13-type metalloendopeptidase [Undibacterium sp. CCC2.1]MEB0173071.1 M13-type metalloendopeptidase [Undibacterium sp. CCC1.1]MEB0176123.1 M13-type metalloendopeptidase [Undibacterium sp. CCC3.4]MEB0215389.1 M13-type metalloendopeptidase [Undibacterium sp. 5I2]WPX42730.1 M13-type metalloendopeptidase [Undibacterium sp. CCC3.4]
MSTEKLVLRTFIRNPNLLSGAAIMAMASAFLLSGCGGLDKPAVVQRNEQACTDFEQLVNGDWYRSVQRTSGDDIPDAFSDLPEQNYQSLLTALEAAASSPLADENSDLGKLVRLFVSQSQPAPATMVALNEEWQLVDSMAQVQEVPVVMAKLLLLGTVLPLKLSTQTNQEEDVEPVELKLAPNYLGFQGNTVEARREHIARMLGAAGVSADQAAIDAAAVERMEQRINRPENSTPTSMMFDILAFKQQLGVAAKVEVDAATAATLSQMMAEFTLPQWKSFFKWRLLKSFSAYLPGQFSAEEKRWKTGWQPQFLAEQNGSSIKTPIDNRVRFLAALMPDTLNRFFVEKLIGPNKLAAVNTMMQELKHEMRARIETRAWLSQVGRDAALHRLVTMAMVVVQPTRWIDYSKLTVDANDALANIKRVNQLNFAEQVQSAGALPRLGAKGGYGWSEPNPRYVPGRNAMVGDVSMILTSPMVDFENNIAFTYGFLGASILAHEMAHGFDASGTQAAPSYFPLPMAMGLANSDISYFKSMEDRQYHHYSAYAQNVLGVQIPILRVTNEDMADLIGLEVATQLVQKKWPGAAAADQFFKGYAASHRDAATFDELRDYASYVPAHAVNRYRINGVLSNSQAFAANYGCTAGDPMVRADKDRISLW